MPEQTDRDIDRRCAEIMYRASGRHDGVFWDDYKKRSLLILGSEIHKARIGLGIDDEFDGKWEFIFAPTIRVEHDYAVLFWERENWKNAPGDSFGADECWRKHISFNSMLGLASDYQVGDYARALVAVKGE